MKKTQETMSFGRALEKGIKCNEIILMSHILFMLKLETQPSIDITYDTGAIGKPFPNGS